VKAEVFDSVLANLSLFPKRLCILPPIKEKEGDKSLPNSPPELVQPAGGHLYIEKILMSDAKAVLRIVGDF
jgi:hypothetical protein